MSRVPLLICAGASLLVSFATAGETARHMDPSAIRATVERHVRELAGDPPGLEVTAGRLDPRLALAECDGELTPFLPPGSTVRARVTAGLRCEGSRPWSIYLPVDVVSDADVLVARRPLARGESPLADDFTASRRRVPGLAVGYPATPEALAGRKLRRPITAGELLKADALEPIPLVRRGQQVTLIARAGGIDVRVAGIALSDAGAGDRLRMQNPASGRTVEGTVQPDGSVATSP